MTSDFQPYINCRYRLQNIHAGKNEVFTAIYLPGSNDIINADITCEDHEDGYLFSITIETVRDIAIELLSVVLHIPCIGVASAIDRYYKTIQVNEELWNNDLTPIHISYADENGRWLIKNRTPFVSHKISPAQNGFQLELYADASALHPQTNYEKGVTSSSASQVVQAGRKYTLDLVIIKQDDAHYPLLRRFPYGHNAAFAITDHCDFDETPNLQRLMYGNDGKAEHVCGGLRITKGVFTLHSKKDGFLAETLQNPAYLQLVEVLHSSGNEIAPHALQQSKQISVDQFQNALNWLQERFGCRSWIEHGNYLNYSYYMGGKHNEYRLTDNLVKRDYTNIWSYYDIPVDPFRSLNMLDNSRSGFFGSLSPAFRKMFKGKVLYALHIFRSYMVRLHHGQGIITYLVNLLAAGRPLLMAVVRRRKVKYAVSNLFKTLLGIQDKKEISYLPYTEEEIRNFSPVFFSEDCKPLSQYRHGELLMFTTQEILHTSDVYTTAALHRLVHGHGIHIAHTYILNRLPYINGIFKKDGQLKDEWVGFVRKMQDMTATGSVWNNTISEIAEYFGRLATLVIRYQTKKIIVENISSHSIPGLSFSLGYTAVPPLVYWNNDLTSTRNDEQTKTLVFWGDIAPGSVIVIRWE